MEHTFDERTKKLYLIQYSREGKKAIESPIKPFCFVRGKSEWREWKEHGSVELKEFLNPAAVGYYKYSNECFEADKPFIRTVMIELDWQIDDVPTVYLDIEVWDKYGFPKVERDPIVCIGMETDIKQKIFLHIADFCDTFQGRDISNLPTEQVIEEMKEANTLKSAEKAMLMKFMQVMENIGVGITFNGGEDPADKRAFDLPYLAGRFSSLMNCSIKDFDFALRHCRFFDIKEIYKTERKRVGKALKGGYSLNNIAMEELKVGKVDRGKPIYQMTYTELYQYNLEHPEDRADVELTRRLCKKTKLIDMKIGLAKLTNSLLVSWNFHKERRQDEIRPLILVDNMVIKEAHKHKLVVHDRKYANTENETIKKKLIGALVLDPKPGVHFGVQNYDVQSMYPNIIINEKISPDKERKIIPLILVDLIAKRKEFKRQWEEKKAKEGIDDDNLYILQYNYKVLCNVFYGALGSQHSRIFDIDLANATTGKGRELLQTAVDTAKSLMLEVDYGDTDSCFIEIEEDKVVNLQTILNKKLAPYKMGIGEYYKAILFVTDPPAPSKKKKELHPLNEGTVIEEIEVADEEEGVKKRYAGIDKEGKMVTKGLETVRGDRCDLARMTQEQVLRLILTGKKFEEIKQVLDALYLELKTGKYNPLLPIRKGVKELSEYKSLQKVKKDGTLFKGAPHIRAYKKLLEMGSSGQTEIAFFYTTEDVVPYLEDNKFPENIDYEKYWRGEVLSVLRTIVWSAYQIDIRQVYKPAKKVREKKVKVAEKKQEGMLLQIVPTKQVSI